MTNHRETAEWYLDVSNQAEGPGTTKDALRAALKALTHAILAQLDTEPRTTTEPATTPEINTDPGWRYRIQPPPPPVNTPFHDAQILEADLAKLRSSPDYQTATNGEQQLLEHSLTESHRGGAPFTPALILLAHRRGAGDVGLDPHPTSAYPWNKDRLPVSPSGPLFDVGDPVTVMPTVNRPGRKQTGTVFRRELVHHGKAIAGWHYDIRPEGHFTINGTDQVITVILGIPEARLEPHAA